MKKFGPDWPRSCSDTFGEEWKQRHSVPRCLDFEQVLASSRCTASFRHNHGTVCRAVLDVLQVLASSHCTASFRRNHGTLCRAVLDVLQVLASFWLCSPQVFLTTTAPCAALCWMSCKCSLLRAAPQVVVRTRHRVPRCAVWLASARIFASHCRFSSQSRCAALCWMSSKCSHLRAAPEVFITATPCAALCWMSRKCSHLRAAPDLFVTGKHPVPNVSEPLRAEYVRTTLYIHKQKCFVFA